MKEKYVSGTERLGCSESVELLYFSVISSELIKRRDLPEVSKSHHRHLHLTHKECGLTDHILGKDPEEKLRFEE